MFLFVYAAGAKWGIQNETRMTLWRLHCSLRMTGVMTKNESNLEREVSTVSKCRDHRGWGVSLVSLPVVWLSWDVSPHYRKSPLTTAAINSYICLRACTASVIHFPGERLMWYSSLFLGGGGVKLMVWNQWGTKEEVEQSIWGAKLIKCVSRHVVLRTRLLQQPIIPVLLSTGQHMSSLVFPN